MIRLGIVGAGKRVHAMYAPTLATLEDVEVSGFWNRDATKGQRLTDAFGYKRFTDLHALAKESDALAIAVNSSALTEVTLAATEFGKPLLAETPVWTKDVVQAAKSKGVSLAIAEQTAFLPSEQFKMKLLDEQPALFGKPHTVVNDHRTFEYHGLAQLRRYIGFDKTPVEVCGMSHSRPMFPFRDGNDVEQRGHVENWDHGQVRFATGEMAVYNFSSLYNRCKYRQPRSLRIYTDRASISNDDNEFTVVVGQESSYHRHVPIEVTVDPTTRKTLSIAARNVRYENYPGIDVVWSASNKQLDDQQEGLHVILKNFVEHVRDGTPLLYDAQQGWTDYNLLMAIRHSSATRSFVSR